MIVNHHKIRPARGPYAPTVDAFRRADRVDVSLGYLERRPHVAAEARWRRRLVAGLVSAG